ncbi:MAG: hypothetical protein F4091_07105 [Acidimicrobiales bacterium]|nr:hypothetical protein [Acidimicrobiales bacterium]MYJ65216.1 hypothetical protein [Acidimicrobiales bacterium]
MAVTALLMAASALAVVASSASAQSQPVGKILTTATWRYGPDGPPAPDEAPSGSGWQKYQDIVRNFFQNGFTNVDTTIEIEDILDRNGVIVANKVTVRCHHDYICTWNGQDVRDENGNDTGAFTATRKAVNVKEREYYEDPSDEDVAGASNPVGSAGAHPTGRTVTYKMPAFAHCGEMGLSADQSVYNHYMSDVKNWNEVQIGNPETYPTQCVLSDPEARYDVMGPDPDNPGQTIVIRQSTTGEELPATMKPIYECRGNGHSFETVLDPATGFPYYTLRGTTCTWTAVEHNPAGSTAAEDRRPTLTTPGQGPEYEPPTEREIENCNRRSDHESCNKNLIIDAENDFDREAERHDAQWQRYEQELGNLIDQEAQFWACMDYDVWKELVESGGNINRCYLVS